MSTKKPAEERSRTNTRPYSDGHPEDEVQYRELKIILHPERLATRKSFDDFAKLVRHTAKSLDIALFRDELPPQFRLREVLFFDTPAFDLYNGAFIFRRRTFYRDGWPENEPELTLKFRHTDMALAAATDVRPAGHEIYRIKFKEEVLPARDGSGGMRTLYSHNSIELGARTPLPQTFDELAHVFPAVRRLSVPTRTPLTLVNDLAVEEVLCDVGELHFGHGLQAKATVALWRNRGTQAPLSGEFAYQCKFRRYDELHEKSKKRTESFFTSLQKTAHDWVYLAGTKTKVVYGIGGGTLRNHE